MSSYDSLDFAYSRFTLPENGALPYRPNFKNSIEARHRNLMATLKRGFSLDTKNGYYILNLESKASRFTNTSYCQAVRLSLYSHNIIALGSAVFTVNSNILMFLPVGFVVYLLLLEEYLL
ncbi:hypothetical protein O9992_25790 [Vibrio lentus]|nr:hypothetical protein [Vibrio lentus]